MTLADARQPELPLIYANNAFQSLTGYQFREIVGKNCRFLQGEETDPQAVDLIRSAIARRESASCLLLNYRKDGKPFWNRFQMSPLFDAQGDIEAFLGIQVDVSGDIRRVDIERERQKLEALGRLSGGMAHELNNALQPIMLLSEILQDDAALPAQDRQRHLATIFDNATYGRDIVSRVLNFARRGSDGETWHNAIPLVRDAIRFAQGTLPSSMECVINDALDGSFAGKDADQVWRIPISRSDLHQVMLNLFNNAVHATDSAGRIEVLAAIETEKPRKSDCTDPDDQGFGDFEGLQGWLRFAVRDNGHGMSVETKRRAFEPFFTTKECGQGTGLGLSMIYGTIHALGGTVTIESKPNNGTAFDLRLPVRLTTTRNEG